MADCTEYLALLKSDDKEIIREGAFRAGENNCVEAVEQLAKLLLTNHLGIQEAADSSLRMIGGKETVRAVLPLLRSDEAPVRNLSMDILREVGWQDMPSLIELAHDADPDIRIFAADILGSTDSPLAVEPLCEALLKDLEVNVRYQAAVSLGELGMDEAAPCLNKAINDEEWVQYSVIEALTKIGHASSVDALVKTLDSASDLVASMIIDSLGEMGNVKAVSMLLKRLDNSHTALRNKIVKAVVKILGGKSLTLLSEEERDRFQQYLLVALEDEDEETQDAAIQGLAHVGGEKASEGILKIASSLDPDIDHERFSVMLESLAHIGITEPLKEGVMDDDQNVAQVAVQVLSRVTPNACTEDQEVCDILMEAFWKVGLQVQRQIVATAAEQADESAKDFFIRILEEHTDGTVLKSAAYLLGEKLQLEACAHLIFPLLTHQYDDVKEAALDACIAIGSMEVQDKFKAMFESEDPLNRLMATYALSRIDALDNIAILKQALNDDIPDIRKVAVEALAEGCQTDAEWRSLVLGRLADESKDVRLTVVEILGKCFDESFVQDLIGALDDEDDWVKIRAVDALSEHRCQAAVDKFIGMLEYPNRFVVMKVIEALGVIGGANAFRALLAITDSDEYELVSAAENAINNIQDSQE